jgi:hypothetical protein
MWAAIREGPALERSILVLVARYGQPSVGASTFAFGLMSTPQMLASGPQYSFHI